MRSPPQRRQRSGADNGYVAAQELVQGLREQSSTAEDRLCAANAHVEDCIATLAATKAANEAAQEAMKVQPPSSHQTWQLSGCLQRP